MFNLQVELEINYVAQTIVVKDNTDYSELDFNNITVTGEGTLLGPGGISIASGVLINISGGDTESAAFPLPLDNNGNIVPGSYTLTYATRFVVSNFPINQFTSGPNTIWISGENWQNVLDQTDQLVQVTVSGATTVGNDGIKDLAAPYAVWNGLETEIAISTALTAEAGGSAEISFNTKYLTGVTVEVTWNGANIVKPCIEAPYDCRSTRYGQINFQYSVNLPQGATLISRTWTINYPPFLTGPPTPAPLISSAPSVTITTLAYGPWSAQLALNIEVTQPDGLVYSYTATVVKGFTVKCSGSICALLKGMKSFFDRYTAAAKCGSPTTEYATTADLINGYYALVVEAQSCGDNDAYEKYYALLQAALGSCESSGCSGGCSGGCSDCGTGCGESGGGCDDCQEDSVGWVDNGSDAYSNDLSESIFATATPVSPNNTGLTPNSTVLPENTFGVVNVPASYFQFAAEMDQLGLTTGKRFVDVRYQAKCLTTNSFTTELQIGSNQIIQDTLDQDWFYKLHARIGTKKSGTSTIFTVQVYREVVTATNEIRSVVFYDEFPNLILSNGSLAIEHIFGGAAPVDIVVFLAEVTPIKVK
jgi:hypothetical protein